MNSDGYTFMADRVAKFFNTIHVSGFFHHETDRLSSVSVNGKDIIAQVSEVNVAHGVDATLGSNKGFFVHAIQNKPEMDEDAEVSFTTEGGWTKATKLSELTGERFAAFPSLACGQQFRRIIGEFKDSKLLDIGGRDRSGFDRSQHFPGIDYTVLDIVPGKNVDVVGDAHKLSAYFPHNHFDAVISVSVFEHLLMPWKVAIEMNRVMKLGGVALIKTHQTVGMHDMPWDFFRFSDTSWKSHFNQYTGFEIINCFLEWEHFVIPCLYRKDKWDAEHALGYETSIVMVRKTGECTVDWPVSVDDIVRDRYPEETSAEEERVRAETDVFRPHVEGSWQSRWRRRFAKGTRKAWKRLLGRAPHSP